jgi:acyl transferase domain-containing protein
MPSICEMGNPEQLLTLQIADRALKDAGIDPEKEDLRSTEIIIGRGGYLGGFLQQAYQKIEVLPQVINILHQLAPELNKRKLVAINAELRSCFAHINSERSVLMVPNISTGRIANRFNMMGANYTIDAACASALIAAENAVMTLRQKRCDRVITGGIFLASTPSFWWLFSRLEAFSASGVTQPFSKCADGMLAGEGIGTLVFERLADAVGAGRRIYAVIKGIGTASDGKGTGLLAPRKEGQLECLRRAYRDAGIDPQTIDLLEGHGTATKLGDRIELEAINDFFGISVDGIPIRALGSVKSMIGHTMPASGAASLIKMALSLYHKILPPTLCEGEIADGLKHSQFYLNTETRPWIHPADSKRRAGVNAFGFGGINGHAVLEEYDEQGADIDDLVMDWPMELFLLAGNTPDELRTAIRELMEEQNHYRHQNKPLGLLSMHVCRQGNKFLKHRLAVLAENFEALAEKLQKAFDLLTETRGQKAIQADGIYFEAAPLNLSGKIAFVFPGNAFPGLGDDYTVRLGELCLYLPCFRLWFDRLEQTKSLPDKPYRFSTLLFSPTKLDHERFVQLKKELRILDNSASGVFIANAAGYDLMSRLGVFPDIITGTSLGEWSAAVAAGMIALNQVEGMNVYVKGPEIDRIKGAVGLTQCSLETLKPYLDDFNRDRVTVTCSMDLSPQQVVFAGEREAVEQFCKNLNQAGIWALCLNLFPIHTPLCQPIADLIYRRLEGLRVSSPSVPAYSAATTAPFPVDAEKMRTLLADNAVLPVQMRTLFAKLYDEGARIFVQLGGGGKIATPISETIGDRAFAVLPLDVAHRHPIHQLQHVIASLYAHHTTIKTDLLFDFRKRHLNRSAGQKNKRSEFVVQLNTAIPKFKVKNERLDLEEKADEPETMAFSETSSANVQRMQNTASGPSEWEEILCGQLNTMTRMYASQKEDEVAEMSHFTHMLQCQAQLIAWQSADSLPPVDPPLAVESLPFIDKIEAHTAHQKIVVRHKLSLAYDLFLKDHAFIPCPNDVKPPEEKLPTLPMAVALEMISEAAQTLFPAKTVRGLKHIQNKKWINLTERVREKKLVITARVSQTVPSKEIEVNCTIAVAPDEKEICFAGTVLLADDFYPGNPLLCIDAKPEATRRCDTFDPKTLYRPGGLYHGRCFQGLEGLMETTDTGVEALLTVPSVKGFFADRSGDAMILPAQTIDVASQLIFCHDSVMKTKNNWVAPVSIERILRCKPSPAPGDPVRSKLIIRGNDSNLVMFDLLIEADGEIFMVIVGWRDWRMKWSERLLASWRNPSVNLLARRKRNHTTNAKNDDPVYWLAPKELSGVDTDWLARFYLNASEYEFWHRFPQENRIEPLMKIIAVKDVARGWLQQKNIFLYPSQVATKQLSEERFQVRITGSRPSRSMHLFVETAKQGDETVAKAVLQPIEDMDTGNGGW